MTTDVPAREAQILFGIPLQAMTIDEVAEFCVARLRERQRTLIGVVNAAKVVAMNRDTALRESVLECDVIVADGQSVVWASRVLRRPLPERVTGIDLFERLLAIAERDHLSVYLLGATPEVLKVLRDHLRVAYPKLKIAGSRDGYFAEDQGCEVAADIRRSGSDMLFVGMGSPTKEIFLGEWGSSLGVPILHGVGGSFDVLAGVTKRAPQVLQRLGLEWAYRLAQEPRRLWKRYLVGNIAFMGMTLRAAVSPREPYARPTLSVKRNAADDGLNEKGTPS